ncbi:MAG: hypothetical protein PHI66_05045 [Candidatus Pacebacteria bacterium]|nr:hypothetical protein [Candidatus Paceibacterota bacterium]
MNEYLKEKLFLGLVVACILLAIAMLFNLPKVSVPSKEAETIDMDSDGDGLFDNMEEVVGTDKNDRDTDGDGYEDLAELKNGFNPLVKTPGDKFVDSAYSEIKNRIKDADPDFFTKVGF